MNARLKTGSLALLVWLVCGVPASAATPANPKVVHLLNRISFGARPGDIQNVESMGIEAYIQQQLHPETIAESPELQTQLAQLETLNRSPMALLQQFRPQLAAGQKPEQTTKRMSRLAARHTLQQVVEARLLRATESDRQLQEVMVNFWYNHFNVFSGKGIDRVWVGSYEQNAIRPYALGNFRELLGATARHPAMLYYLDNWQNSAPNGTATRGRFQGLNENYARELMELHTLGVDGGYTQQDVIALAKILTGWGFRRGVGQNDTHNGFYFNPKRHDFSDKVFLGYRIKGGGEVEVERALDLLAQHPATARHLSYQLAQYFVADQPPKALVDRLTQRFQATNGNIREVLNTLFHSREFWDTRYYNAKFKTPYEYVVSAFRAADLPVRNPQFVQNTLQQLGMPVYGCLTPNGYKNTQETWLNPDGMSRRLSFATAIANGRLPAIPTTAAIAPAMPAQLTPASPQFSGAGASPTSIPSTPAQAPAPAPAPLDPDQLLITLGDRLSQTTQTAIAASPPNLRAALILGSPEFMHR